MMGMTFAGFPKLNASERQIPFEVQKSPIVEGLGLLEHSQSNTEEAMKQARCTCLMGESWLFVQDIWIYAPIRRSISWRLQFSTEWKKTCFPFTWATPKFMMFFKSPIALLWALKNMIHVYMPAYAAHMCSDHDGCPVRISLAISSSPPHQCGAFLVDLEYVKTLSCQKPDRFSQHYVQFL